MSGKWKDSIIPDFWNKIVEEIVKTGDKPADICHRLHPDKSYTSSKQLVYRLFKDKRFVSLLRQKAKAHRRNEIRSFTYSESNYYDGLVGIATFDIAELFELDPVTKVTKLRDDWIKIAKKYKALESIQVDVATLESGMVIQRIKLKPCSKMNAIEKLGRLSGWDTTMQRDVQQEAKTEEVQDKILKSMQLIKGMIEEKKIDPKAIDVEELKNCEIIEEEE